MKNKEYYIILIITIMLTLFGLLMVYSSSNVVAAFKYDDEYYYLKRQLLFAGIGLSFMLIVSKININIIIKRTIPIFIISIMLLLIVLIPGIGLVRGGARSWLGYGSISFQPSELIKVTIILFLGIYCAKYESELVKIKKFITILLIIFIIFGIIMLQPDFGTGLVIVLSSLLILYLAGCKIKYFLILLLMGLIGIICLILSAPYRLERILAFIDPWSDPLGSGFQTIQSIYAIAPSGLFGLGYNNSIQKHFFLPEPQNDFIFAIIAEELGYIGCLFLLGLFFILLFTIVKVAKNSNNKKYKYILLGISCSFFIQISINISVVIGLLPVTGITLPFISYGGTSLCASLFLIGVVLNLTTRGF